MFCGHHNIPVSQHGKSWRELYDSCKAFALKATVCLKLGQQCHLRYCICLRLSLPCASLLRGKIACKHLHVFRGEHPQTWQDANPMESNFKTAYSVQRISEEYFGNMFAVRVNGAFEDAQGGKFKCLLS